MSKPNEERDIYYIPPNFLASGRLFGGMIRARNAIEACVLVLLTGIPIIKLPMSLTVRIIILCLLPLPLGIFGIIGFEGDSLSEFAINWVRWFIHRRNLYRSDVTIPETARKQKKRIWEQEATKPPEELGIRIKQPRKKRKRPAKTEKQLNKNNRKMVPSHKKQVTYSEDFVPVKDIRNGIIEMEDGRYIRVLEVEPINFLLRSTSEQKNIVASFASWMKISPIKIQIKVLTKKADIGKHLSTIERDMESESNPKCRELQLDYYRLIQTIGSREAITRRFLVIFEYEAVTNRKPEYSEIVSALETTVQTARQYFLHCDNAVVTHDDENAFLLEILYTIFNRSTCEVKTVEQRIGELQLARRDTDITVPVSLKSVLAPDSIDLTHGSYVVMDGVYHAYLIVPSDGYNPRVVAGWTSILVNAGEGIDVDFYFSREPKERIQAKLGQQIRINRSRLKDTSDTQYPESDFGSSSFISGGGTIEMPYEPSVTLNDLKQSDGSIGQVSIDRVGLNCKVYEGATDSSMSKGAGHYSSSGLYTGNVGLFGHNRGNHPYFGKLKNVKDGDIVKYKTAIGTKTYKVTFVGAISYTDFSYLNEMGDNRITLITCIANQPSLRLCVQAVEIR